MSEPTENVKSVPANRKTIAIAVAAAAAILIILIAFVLSTGGNDGLHGIAATVNGTEIPESDVTERVEQYRQKAGFDTDELWAQQLADIHQTPSVFRETIIREIASDIVYEQLCEQNGVTVTDEEVDGKVEDAKAFYNNYSDYSFEDMLTDSKITEEMYWDDVRRSLIKEKMVNCYRSMTLSDAELIQYVNDNLSIIEGAREFAVIVTESREQAEAALSKLKSGEAFDAVQEEYSITTAYDGYNTLPVIGTEALEIASTLDEGEISDVIEASDRFFILECVTVLHFPAEGIGDLSEIPSEFLDSFKEDISHTTAVKTFNAAMDAALEDADIQINEMPKGLPYDVNMDGYTYQGFKGIDASSKKQAGESEEVYEDDASNSGSEKDLSEDRVANGNGVEDGPSNLNENGQQADNENKKRE